ncbi:unnamed protein product, partial [Symbiodinium necroappetens]
MQESQKEALHFGYPPQLVSALQAIAARATSGLFKDPMVVAADRTAQQQAQSQANILDRLGKRMSGNAKAKQALREASLAWVGKLGQHLAALTSRLQTVADRLDRDQSEAISDLQAATIHLESGTDEQITQALASMGPVWSQPQEAEVLRLAASLRAFAAVGTGPTPGPQLNVGSGVPPQAMASGPGSIMGAVGLHGAPLLEGQGFGGSATPPASPSPVAPGHALTSVTPARSSASGDGMDTSGADTTAKRRRELDLSAEPWTKAATGLTPERPSRAAAPDEEELIPAVSTTPLTWTTAWFQVSRQCWEQGSAVVGQLAVSECQEQVFPLQHLVSDPDDCSGRRGDLDPTGSCCPATGVRVGGPAAGGEDARLAWDLPRTPVGSAPGQAGLVAFGTCHSRPPIQYRCHRSFYVAGMALPSGASQLGHPAHWFPASNLGLSRPASPCDDAVPPTSSAGRARL